MSVDCLERLAELADAARQLGARRVLVELPGPEYDRVMVSLGGFKFRPAASFAERATYQGLVEVERGE